LSVVEFRVKVVIQFSLLGSGRHLDYIQESEFISLLRAQVEEFALVIGFKGFGEL